jgi:hypothetical protein
VQIKGDIYKRGKFWIIECPTLDASTQGRSRSEALSMMVDWVRTVVDDDAYPVEIQAVGKSGFEMTFSRPGPVVAVILTRTRMMSKATLAEVARALGSKSPNSVYQYETGRHDPSFQKVSDILRAMGFELVVSVAKAKSRVA